MTEAEKDLTAVEAAIADLPAEQAHRILRMSASQKSSNVRYLFPEQDLGEEQQAAYFLAQIRRKARK